MKKFLLATLVISVLLTGCGSTKNSSEPQSQPLQSQSQSQSQPQAQQTQPKDDSPLKIKDVQVTYQDTMSYNSSSNYSSDPDGSLDAIIKLTLVIDKPVEIKNVKLKWSQSGDNKVFSLFQYYGKNNFQAIENKQLNAGEVTTEAMACSNVNGKDKFNFEKQTSGEYVLSIEGVDEKGKPWVTSVKTVEDLRNL